MSVTKGIKLDDATSKRLKTLSSQLNRSAHWLMRDAIERYLAEEELYQREKAEDMARWENYLLTGEAVDNETVKKWLKDLSEGKNTVWRDYR